MAGSGKIRPTDLHHLVHHMSKHSFRVKDSSDLDEQITSHCLFLCGKDYKYSVVDNRSGELCNHYPSKLILLEYECRDTPSRHESIYNLPSITDMFVKARFARCRTRFVMPVILVEGKHICRSSTISSGGEMYGRLGLDLVFSNGETAKGPSSYPRSSTEADGDTQVFDRIRGYDIKLLKELKVNHICDLMLENKKVKYFLNVTSSEKVDKLKRYSEFCVWSLPYPGCEFFKNWRDKNYDGEKAQFDWSQDFVDAPLELPPHNQPNSSNAIHWQEYKRWNLIQLTQNYLRVILHHIQTDESGLLIHCISGWDRTPLFISLVRLSLWADGLVHKSLSPLEILYFTIAYDWYLFGHNLPDRLQKGEEVFFFCFYFLKYIQDEEFTLNFSHHNGRTRNMSSTDLEQHCPLGLLLDSDFPPFGSSSSLCSDVSLASRTDGGAPLLFMADSADGTMTSASHSSTADVSTNPVTVPRTDRTRRPPSVCSEKNSASHSSESPIVGSWQVVTGTGSYAGSHSPFSPSEGQRSSFSGSDVAKHSSSSLSELCEPSARCRKLEEVRSLFYNAYASTIGFKNGPEPSGLSSLLDLFADKMAAIGNKLT